MATDVQVSQGEIKTVVGNPVDANVSQGQFLAAVNFPSKGVRVSQASIAATIKPVVDTQVAQAQILVAARGRIDNRRLRAWTFSLDGHDFYVLRLGETETLVYDLTTGTWSNWASPNKDTWRANIGGNWIGLSRVQVAENGATGFAIGGDDAAGQLWFIKPEVGYDQDLFTDDPAPFTRRVTGMVPSRSRDYTPCNAVEMTLSLGEPAITGASISLSVSDDAGKTWTNYGAIAVEPGVWDQLVTWQSLGSMRAPGRMFLFEDDGAAVRISGAEMPLNSDDPAQAQNNG